ncbi:MAG: glycosyltransferase [Armatimonadota bacterium]|nr:glycosyltransferase [Armatimonadota bacterium]
MLRVSVVVPARNEEPRIGACLRALLAQDYPREAYEVIVVDDGSTDRTAEVAEGFGLVVLRQRPLGRAAALNLGVNHARGEVVAFTEADCVPAPDWLRRLVTPFADGSVGACSGEVLGAGGSWVTRYVEATSPLRLSQRMRAKPWPVFVGSNMAYRKAVFQTLGGFDASVGRAEDLEMTWRVARDGRFHLAACPGAVVYHARPETVWGLGLRWWEYGAAKALVARKFRGRGAIITYGVRTVALVVLTAALAPLRTLRRLLRRKSDGIRLLVPWLDVLRAIAFGSGYWAVLLSEVCRKTWRQLRRSTCLTSGTRSESS